MSITLAAARVNAGFTQKEAADSLGITANTLVNYERGKTFPNVPLLKRIEKLYEVPYSELIFSDEENTLSVKQGNE